MLQLAGCTRDGVGAKGAATEQKKKKKIFWYHRRTRSAPSHRISHGEDFTQSLIRSLG